MVTAMADFASEREALVEHQLLQKPLNATKENDGLLRRPNLVALRFVPLIGEEGWSNA